MARKNSAHDIVIESLTEALLQLMEKKPFSEISVSELCMKAGVGRMSFYRNYSSVRDILSDILRNVPTNGGKRISISRRKILTARSGKNCSPCIRKTKN